VEIVETENEILRAEVAPEKGLDVTPEVIAPSLPPWPKPGGDRLQTDKVYPVLAQAPAGPQNL
jgi:hypothetical protein